MNSLRASLMLDVLLQSRSRLYAIGVVVALMLGLAGRAFFGRELAGPVLGIFYLTAIGGTTYLFAAALVLLEKSEGTLGALRASPLSCSAYLASKTITLTTFASIESLIVLVIAFPGVPAAPGPLALGLVSLGSSLTLLGLGQVASHEAITSFLAPGAMAVSLVLSLPCLDVLGVGPSAAWCLIPTQGPLQLFLGAFDPIERWRWTYGVVTSLATPPVAWWWARRQFVRHVWPREG